MNAISDNRNDRCRDGKRSSFTITVNAKYSFIDDLAILPDSLFTRTEGLSSMLQTHVLYLMLSAYPSFSYYLSSQIKQSVPGIE